MIGVTANFDDTLWFAIAEPSRKRLIDILLKTGEASASRLAQEVTFTRQAVAKHMNVLAKAGLVRHRRIGKEVRYAVQAEGLAAASREMSRAAMLWDEKLQNIKYLAEAIHNDKGDIQKRTMIE